MLNRLCEGIDNFVSGIFGNANISIEKTTNEDYNRVHGFTFYHLKTQYNIRFYADKEDSQQNAYFHMKVTEDELVHCDLKECIEAHARSNSNIEKTRYLGKKEIKRVGELRDLRPNPTIDIKCRIKKFPVPKEEKIFYNVIWAYLIKPAMQGVSESVQSHSNKVRKVA